MSPLNDTFTRIGLNTTNGAHNTLETKTVTNAPRNMGWLTTWRTFERICLKSNFCVVRCEVAPFGNIQSTTKINGTLAAT